MVGIGKASLAERCAAFTLVVDARPGLGPDPYLSGALVYQTITGIQDNGVTACAKVGEELHPVLSAAMLIVFFFAALHWR